MQLYIVLAQQKVLKFKNNYQFIINNLVYIYFLIEPGQSEHQCIIDSITFYSEPIHYCSNERGLQNIVHVPYGRQRMTCLD